MKKTFLAIILAVLTATAFYYPNSITKQNSVLTPAPNGSQFITDEMSIGDDMNYTNMNANPAG